MESRPDGLTDAEVAWQLALHGPNRLPEARAALATAGAVPQRADLRAAGGQRGEGGLAALG